MTSLLFLLLVRGSQSDSSGSVVVLVLIGLVVVAIAGSARRVLGGGDEINTVLPPGADSIAGANRDVPEPTHSSLAQESIHGRSGETHAADEDFEAVIATTIPGEAQEKAFYVRVRGTSHRNDDRTSRTRIIGQCSIFDPILLVPEPENKFDPNAIAVRRRENNEQLGYLDSRLAGEITRDENKHGPHWIAFFRRQTRHPETGKTAGAVIRVIRLSDEFIANSDAVRATQVIL